MQVKRRREAADQAHASSTQSGESRDAAADLSKDSFLDILRRGTAGSAKTERAAAKPADRSGGAASRASFMRDDFMLGRHKAKDWGTDVAEDEIDFVEEARGADIDEDSD